MTILEIKDIIVNENKTLYFKDGGRECSLAKDRIINNCWQSKWGQDREVLHVSDDEAFRTKCFGGKSFTDLLGKVDYELR